MPSIHVAGHYTATWSGTDIGTTRNGFTIRETFHDEPIHTDDGGDTAVDTVNRGSDVEVELEYADYAKIKAVLYGHTAIGGGYANTGKLGSAQSHPLVLTAAAGTTAATLDGAKVYTFFLARVKGDINTMLANHARQGPVRLMCLPDPANSNNAYSYV